MSKKNSAAAKLSKLKKDLKKDILILNNDLPTNLGRFWVNSKELHGRLVHAGVDQSLNLDIIQDAIQRLNKDQTYLAVREFDHILYYRSTMCHLEDDNADAVLSVQRFTNKSNGVKKRINLNASKDDFKSIGSTRLAKVNETTEAMNEEDKRIKEQPVETREIGVQAEPASLSDPIELTESYDRNCIMSVQRMEDFIKATNEHTQQCGLSPVLVERCTRMGTTIKWTYRCPVCAGDIILHNCDKVRTKVVAQTASRS